MKVSLNSIDQVVDEALNKYGVHSSSLEILKGSIRYANRSGISTHGIRQLPMYIDKIISGHLNPIDEVGIVVEYNAITILDAKNTFGQVAANHALVIGKKKANDFGIALVGVRNSNTFGAAGYFGYLAAKKGMASIIFANAAPAIAPSGGNKAIFGTNPLCFAFPGSKNNEPIVLDMATTVAARSKIKMAANAGDKIPEDWAVGPDGKRTNDPNVALLGSLLPIAGYKGYGLSLFIDVFAGLMTGSAYAGAVKQLSDTNNDSNTGQFYIFMDVTKFMSYEEFESRISHFHMAVKNCGEKGVVMLPGEPGYRKMAEQKDCVDISVREFDDVNLKATEIGINARLIEIK